MAHVIAGWTSCFVPGRSIGCVIVKDKRIMTTGYNGAPAGLKTAPIKAGEMIATVAVKYRNSYVAEAEIYAMNNVASASGKDVSIRSTAVKDGNSMGGFLGFVGVVGIIAVGGFALYLGYNAYRRTKRRIQRRRRRASRRRSY